MPKGIPVVISDNGYGIPVTPVSSGAPLATIASNRLGTPIVITENGTPFIIDGIGPDDPKWQTFFLIAGNNAFGWGYAIPPLVSAPLGDILNEPYTGSNLIAFFEAPDDSRIIVCFSGNLVSELTGHTFNINGATLDVMTPPVYDAVNDWTIMYLESFWMIEGQAYVIYRVEATNVFSPSELFANGEQGGWYDPSDLSTLFQTSTGGVPALPGDPVGLVLDKSEGFVPVEFSDPANGTVYSFATFSLSGKNIVRAANDEPGFAGSCIRLARQFPQGTILRLSFDIEVNSENIPPRLAMVDGNPTGSGVRRSNTVRSVVGSNVIHLIINSAAGSDLLQVGGDNDKYDFGLSNLRIEELPGNHLSQPATAASPTLMDVSDDLGLRFDLVDDALTTVLPQAINGDILIAGRNGTIIEPVSYAAGSTFSLGPTTYTGGTPGILAAVGDIVGVLLIDKTLSQVERDNLVAYYQAKGAGGLL